MQSSKVVLGTELAAPSDHKLQLLLQLMLLLVVLMQLQHRSEASPATVTLAPHQRQQLHASPSL